jgi:hypothetical protein
VNTAPLSADLYEQFHDAAIGGVRNREGQPMETGYRKDPHFGEGFGVDHETWSPEGHAELKRKYQHRRDNDEFVGNLLAQNPDKMLPRTPDGQQLVGKPKVLLRPLGPGEARVLAQGVIDRYHTEITSAHTEDARLTAIARVCQDLDQMHLFADGNIRTVVFLVLNKLLLEQGYSPVIMDEPNVFDAKSVDQLKALIKAGQRRFRSFQPPPKRH